MSKEAMKLAQELRALADRFSEGWHEGIKIDASDIVLLSDAAEALAEQPAPVAKPRKQEPGVAVFELQESGWEIICDGDWIQTLPLRTKLYTSPPASKPWVGLTDDEILYCVELENPKAIAEEVEAKLREKNQ